MAGLNPLADWVVAEQEEAVTKTASGLYLPDKAAEKPKIAKVAKVGKERQGNQSGRPHSLQKLQYHRSESRR